MSEPKKAVLQTREQRFAAAVYTKVDLFNTRYPDTEPKEHDVIRKRYASLCHSLSIMIRSAGLVQALAFAQRTQDNSDFTKDLAAVLGYNDDPLDLLKAAYKADLMEYMFLTEEVLAVLLWFKRFAQSILKIGQADAQTDGATATTELQGD